MITSDDINFMQSAREDAMTGRRHGIVLKSLSQIGTDVYTKQPKYITESHSSEGIVTEISGTSGVAIERKMENGVVIIDGDITISVRLDKIPLPSDEYKTVEYNNSEYMILAADLKGIGERNRVEFLGRVVK